MTIIRTTDPSMQQLHILGNQSFTRYWIEPSLTGGVLQSNMGRVPSMFATQVAAASSSHAYLLGENGNVSSVTWFDTSGSSVETTLSIGTPTAIAADDQGVAVGGGTGTPLIQVLSPDLTSTVSMGPAGHPVTALGLSKTHVYWVEDAGATFSVHRRLRGGGMPELVVAPVTEIRGLVVDDKCLYFWVNTGLQQGMFARSHD
jgi:hypothetical protein